MASNERETKAFMTAYRGLKTAAKTLEEMSRESEPDLDKMLCEVQLAKQHYDQCNQVIETIKAQVESIFDGSANLSNDEPPSVAEEIVPRTSDAIRPGRRHPPTDDDDMPF